MPRLKSVNLLRAETDDHIRYASQALEDWTQSQNLCDAQKDACRNQGMCLGHPEFQAVERA